jgi:hypothetical protein
VHFSGFQLLFGFMFGFIIFNMLLAVVIFFWGCSKFVNLVPKAFNPHH